MDWTGFLPIGRFSQLSRLSLKALRLYDQMGLLRPAYVDPESGYRYYTMSQAREAQFIRQLRRLDMPLSDIRQVLDTPNPTERAALMDEYWSGVEERVAEGRRRVVRLHQLLKGKEKLMGFEVKVKEVPTQPVVSIKEAVFVDRLDPFLLEAFSQLEGHLGQHSIPAAGPRMAIYHGEVNEEQDGPVEACIPVERPVAADGRIRVRELDGGPVAYTAITRPLLSFPEILSAYEAVHDWIGEHGHKTAGPPREVYTANAKTAAPGTPVCEITWPIP
ncbi:MAG: AraC family transcriptional regulator [Dehalococcoidia bacterium]|nr:AraC family transcriptional regulator [Dehalococcoidia bacterium]